MSDPEVTTIAGLTLLLSGRFDAPVLAAAIGLDVVRYERMDTNEVTHCNRGKPDLTYRVSRTIEHDWLKFSVRADKSIDALFSRLFAAIDALPAENQKTWLGLESRTIDLGVYWTNESNCGTEYDIADHIVQRLAAHSISLRISVYGSEEGIDRALAERQRENPTPSDGPTP